MSDLANLDMAPLSAKVDKQAVETYRYTCETQGFVRPSASPGDWRYRYRLATFAQANDLDYLLRADPKMLPGRDEHKKYYVPFEIYDVLMTRQPPRVMLAQLGDPYTHGGERQGAAGHIELIGIGLGRVHQDNIFLESEPFTKKKPDPFDHFFLYGEQVARAKKLLPQALVQAVIDIAPGWDCGLAGEWFYIQHQPWSENAADPKRITEHVDLATRLVPYVAELA